MNEPGIQRAASVCVFCGAKTGLDQKWMALADSVGALLARRGATLVYGGGGVGLMGAVAGGALREAGEVIGIIPHALMSQELGKHEVTRLEKVDTMAQRKTRMLELADAFLVLPGGLGTLDELFEVMTMRQIGQHKKPVALLNVDGYFDKLFQVLDGFTQAGFVLPEDSAYLLVDSNPSQLIDRLLAAH